MNASKNICIEISKLAVFIIRMGSKSRFWRKSLFILQNWEYFWLNWTKPDTCFMGILRKLSSTMCYARFSIWASCWCSFMTNCWSRPPDEICRERNLLWQCQFDSLVPHAEFFNLFFFCSRKHTVQSLDLTKKK